MFDFSSNRRFLMFILFSFVLVAIRINTNMSFVAKLPLISFFYRVSLRLTFMLFVFVCASSSLSSLSVICFIMSLFYSFAFLSSLCGIALNILVHIIFRFYQLICGHSYILFYRIGAFLYQKILIKKRKILKIEKLYPKLRKTNNRITTEINCCV